MERLGVVAVAHEAELLNCEVDGSSPGSSSLHGNVYLGKILNPELWPMHSLDCLCVYILDRKHFSIGKKRCLCE